VKSHIPLADIPKYVTKDRIKAAARLTYKEAFAHLQRPPHDDLTRKLHVAWELASHLRRKRFAAGSLDLEFPEVKVWLDAQGKPRIENRIFFPLRSPTRRSSIRHRSRSSPGA
jgi:exoribonuclease R